MKFSALVPDTQKFGQVYSLRAVDTVDDAIPGNAVYGFTATRTLTLRDSVANAGALVTILNLGSHTGGVLVTINPASGQTIDGGPITIAPKQSVTVVADGLGSWRIAIQPVRMRQTVARSTTYALLKEDLFNSNIIVCTGTFTATLLSAGSIHSGDYVTLKNAGTGTITVATTSSQTVDGAATVTLTANQSITVVSTGSGWLIIDRVV